MIFIFFIFFSSFSVGLRVYPISHLLPNPLDLAPCFSFVAFVMPFLLIAPQAFFFSSYTLGFSKFFWGVPIYLDGKKSQIIYFMRDIFYFARFQTLKPTLGEVRPASNIPEQNKKWRNQARCALLAHC
jgi:hypothetical protein